MLGLREDCGNAGQHVQVQSTDQAQAFDIRQELARRDHPAARLMPTDQRLQGQQLAGFDADDRLEIRQQFVSTLERVAQGPFTLDLVRDFTAHFLVEHRVAVAPGTLDPVHRRIGIAQQVGGLVMELTVGADDTDAAGRKNLMAVDEKRQVERHQDPFGDFDHHIQRGLGRQYRKLIAPQACQHVGLAQTTAQSLGRLHQQQVAKMVAEAVVDHLEAVQIDEHHRQVPALAAEPRPGQIEALLQVGAIR
ncbi:hypothetical protein D3C71_974750 [compost metagenome]